MTNDPASRLFDFAGSNRHAETEDEQMVAELHAALGIENAPWRLRRPPVARRSKSWWRYFPPAAAALLVIALLGASFSAIGPNDENRFASVPPVVLGVQSPAAQSCTLDGDVPLFSGIGESPIDAPSVILTREHELRLVCNGEETVLAEAIKHVTATQTPYVIQAYTDSNEILILNIRTGDRITIKQPQPLPQQQISIMNMGRWLLERSTDDATMASIYDLETFTETPVIAGNERAAFDSVSATMFSADGDSMLLIVENGFFFATAGEEPRFLPANLEDVPRQIAVSMSGDHFAISSYSYREGPGYHRTTISLYDAETGKVLGDWSLDTGDRHIDLAFTNDGSGLLFTDQTALYEVSVESPEKEPNALLEADGVGGLLLTRDANIVLISHIGDDNNGVPVSVSSRINLESGDVTAIDGHDSWTGSPLASMRTTLVIAPPATFAIPETQTMQVVDAVTGEAIGEIEYERDPDSSFGSSTFGVDGNITILAYGTDSIWRLVDDEGNPAVIPVPAVPVDAEALTVRISPDGYISARTFNPQTSWLLLPGGDDWIEIDLVAPEESQGVIPSIEFILGDD